MQINNKASCIPYSLRFDELQHGSTYRIEHILDELVISSFIRCGFGINQVKIPKITSLDTGEVFSIEQARHWNFRLVHAVVVV